MKPTAKGPIGRFSARLLVGICLAGASGALVTRANTTNLSAGADTFINSGDPTNNAGATAWFDAGLDGKGGVRRGLVWFDLSGIPTGSTVTSAVLRLTVIKVPANGPVDSNFDIFRLTTGWNAGAGTGANGRPAVMGEATWNARMNALQPWTAPGAFTDTVAQASASVFIDSALGETYSWSGPSVVSDAQFWVDNPSLNCGWLLVCEAETSRRSVRGFAARENGSSFGNLQIGYTPPLAPSPATLSSIIISNKFPGPPLTTANVPVITNGLVTIQWRGDPNGKFDLLYCATQGSNSVWNVAQPNIPGSPSGSNVLSDPPYLASPAYPPNTNSFYRLRCLSPTPSLAVRLQVVASNLVSPTVLTHAHDGSGRLFVADQVGQVRVVDKGGTLLDTPFLDIANRMVTLQPGYDERGLLGLAFHPGYATNGRFFVYYAAPHASTAFDNKIVLSEFRVSSTDTNQADATSERVLLNINEPEPNHEGAAIVFGPDGYLYLGPGDGGGAGDQHGAHGNAQSLSTFLGKILRLDVDSSSPYAIPADNPFINTPGALPEIFAYGLRNPRRFSFDRGGTRRGFIADVGQNLWEEVSLLRKGANYGWRILEGNHIFDPTVATALSVDIPSLDFPLLEYGHGPMGISIIGGFVYRGAAFPQLVGKYVFGDFSTSFGTPDGQLFYLAETRPGIWEQFAFQLYPGGGRLGRFIKGFGEDQAGELYVLSTTKLGPTGNTGDVRRLVRP